MLVQRGVAELTQELVKEITLDTPVPVGQSYPMFTTRGGNNTLANDFCTVALSDIVNGHYTKLSIERVSGLAALTVSWEVITGTQFKVQSGVTTLSGASVDIGIEEVDATKAVPIISKRSAATGLDQLLIRATLATNHLTLQRDMYGAAVNVTVQYYIVEIDRAMVKTGEVAITSGTGPVTVDVDTDETTAFLLFTWSGPAFNVHAGYSMVEGGIESSTKLSFRRGLAVSMPNPNVPLTIRWYLIQHDSLRVQKENRRSVDSTRPIDAVDLGRSFVTASATSTQIYTSPYARFNTALVTVVAETSTSVVLSGGTSAYCSWFIVEWQLPAPPEGLSPHGVSVMPGEDNIFKFITPKAVSPETQEIRYREQGLAWAEIGPEPYTGNHLFGAGTFTEGKSYEWQVRYKERGENYPTDWSATAMFNTIYPIILRPLPTPESSISLGIIIFGATLKSPTAQNVELKIEIADNEDFTGPVIYELPQVTSGHNPGTDHPMTQAGYWWVRMTATDTLQKQTILVYRFFVGQFLQFFDHPEIQTQGPQATHVTVRVKGATTEYTATLVPEPPAASKIERLVEIGSGVQAQCQEVAEQLLERWGREQRSVTGTVDLIVTLKFDQKVRVKCLPAGIDEEMILQKKEHDILGNPSTRVTLGDIILSDDELLARVLDELVG